MIFRCICIGDQTPFWQKLGAGHFCWPYFGRFKSVEGDKLRSVSNNTRCSKEQIQPQFSKYRFQNELAASHRLWANFDSFWKRYFENCDHICSFEQRKYIFFIRPLYAQISASKFQNLSQIPLKICSVWKNRCVWLKTLSKFEKSLKILKTH